MPPNRAAAACRSSNSHARNPTRTKDKKVRSPVQVRSTLFIDPLVKEGKDDKGRDAAGKSPGHPDRPLDEASLLKGEPVVKCPGNVRVRPRLAHTEQEAHN